MDSQLSSFHTFMVSRGGKLYCSGCELFVADSSHAIAEEDIGAADDEDEDSDSNNNVPKGINRLSCKSLHSYDCQIYRSKILQCQSCKVDMIPCNN